MRVAHLALDLGLGHERGDRVDDDQVDGTGAHKLLGDLERLLAGVRLADEQVLDLHAELAGIEDVERVLGVDEGGHAPGLLHLGDGVQRERGLARGLGPEDLDDPAPRVASDPEGQVEADRAGGDDLDLLLFALAAQPHDRAAPELLLDLGHRRGDRLELVVDFGHATPSFSRPVAGAPINAALCPKASPPGPRDGASTPEAFCRASGSRWPR